MFITRHSQNLLVLCHKNPKQTTLKDWTRTFPQIDTLHTTGKTKAHNSTIQGTVVAVFSLGALVGALSCARLGDILGRRKCIFIAGVLTFVGEILECSSFHLAQFVVGRSLIGIGVGVLSAVVPVWQSECSPAKNRGRHVVLDGLFITTGYVLVAWINLGFYQIKTGSLSWRIPLAIPCLFSIILIASIFFLPESPRWLVRVGRVEEARRTLSALKDLDIESVEIKNEIAGIEFSLEETANKAGTMADILTMKDGKFFYRFMLCIVLQFFQQMSGGNLISVYSTIIFQQGLQLDSQTARILSGGTLTWKLVACFVAFFTIDRFGRRKLFMFSGAGMSACMLLLCIATSFPKSNKPAQVVAVVGVFAFNFFLPIAFLGGNWLYCTEIAPIRLRTAMTSISSSNNWLWNFVVTMITPVAINSIGYKYYIVYVLIGACIPFTVYFWFPETMGQNLEKLDLLFIEDLSIRAIVQESRCRVKKGYTEADPIDYDPKAEEKIQHVEGKQLSV